MSLSIDRARREFFGPLAVGEFVAYWISDDRQHSLPMIAGSHKTAEKAEAAAKACGAEEGIEGGTYEAEEVIAE
ncbi:MAG: hypothetical protein KGJ38_08305 [Burkholderiaceae bacterium]|nr:hypothetical protein [Burkholderiaceae bacterium]